jgi:hypothetical protein
MVKDSSITISHAPIGGHFNSVVELSTAFKTIFKVFEKKANLAFYFQNFMVYRKGKSNCHRQVNLIVADQVNFVTVVPSLLSTLR